MEKENDDIIKVGDFVNDRIKDIEYIQSAIAKDRKKTMLFQRLKYYQRRRSRSGTRNKLNNRRKKRFDSRTHVWYAKRFKMIKINNFYLPYSRNLKSSKYIYKSLRRGFIFEEPYKITKVFKAREEHLLCRMAIKDKFKTVIIEGRLLELTLIDNLLVVSYVINEIEESIFADLELLHAFDCTFLVLLPPTTFDFSRTMKTFDSPLYIPCENNAGKILCSNNQSMSVLLDCIKKSFIPVPISELMRIALEKKILLYPFDYVQSNFFRDFENAINKELIGKYERTPIGKRIELDVNEMYIASTCLDLQYIYFDLYEGIADKNAYIFHDNVIVGRVIRGGFAFSIGKCRGLGYLMTNVNKKEHLYVKNLTRNTMYKISLYELVEVS